MRWRCPRCGHMDIIWNKGRVMHCPFGGTIKSFKCTLCDQYFCVIDDGKSLNEAFNPTRGKNEG